LELLSTKPMSAADVGRALQVNRSTALRLLSTLVDTGYVERDERHKHYSLAKHRVLGLVAGADLPLDWTLRLDPRLSALRDATGDSVVLGAPVGTDMAYLAYYPTRRVVGLSEGVGAVRPMHCSAVGKAYLSALPEPALAGMLAKLAYRGGTERAARDRDSLARLVADAAQEGYATDLEESFDDVRCVAVPLRLGRALVGAVGVTGPASRLPLARIRELGGLLRRQVAAWDANGS
jgi:IclR family pca regulon transcriptional regulator